MHPFSRFLFCLALGSPLSVIARESVATQQPTASVALQPLPSRPGTCRTTHLKADRAKVMGYSDMTTLTISDAGFTLAGRTFLVGTDSLQHLARFGVAKGWFGPPRDSIDGVDVKFGPGGKPQGAEETISRDRSRVTRSLSAGDTALLRQLALEVIARCKSK